ncbi:hypothetical protein DAEQUDRAFT_768802 [Daedalea quercina L-15889]|uniref:Uncharacterized protein n=1 Tax=Daedalea quercina L-15889 TaxID=1314783 RepID=A0A165MDB2_9APHY|nr:hypothetical protein DAEQUDRAFT_768802 [Daedalea quercina L-15889]
MFFQSYAQDRPGKLAYHTTIRQLKSEEESGGCASNLTPFLPSPANLDIWIIFYDDWQDVPSTADLHSWLVLRFCVNRAVRSTLHVERPPTSLHYQQPRTAIWAPASSTSSSSHPTPEPQMFGAPPMFYDPSQAADQQNPRGMHDYNVWAESFGQGGQYANAGSNGYAQAASVPQMDYSQQQQQQPMQDISVAMNQGHNQYQYDQYVPDAHVPYVQPYSQQTALDAPSDRPQRSLPRTSRRGYTNAAQPNVSSMSDSTGFTQQQQQQPPPPQQFGYHTQGDYLFQSQSQSQTQPQPQAPERPTIQTRSSAQAVPTAEAIPQQRFQFAEYRHPDQLVAPAPAPSSYPGGTPTSDVNSFSSSPVSWATDQSQSQGQSDHTAPQAQGTSRKQGGGGRQTQKQTAGGEKGKKRARAPRESDSGSEDDDLGGFAISLSMPPSGGHGGPTRL